MKAIYKYGILSGLIGGFLLSIDFYLVSPKYHFNGCLEYIGFSISLVLALIHSNNILTQRYTSSNKKFSKSIQLSILAGFTYSVISFVFIKLIVPNYTNSMVTKVVSSSPLSSSAAEAEGKYAGSVLHYSAYSQFIWKLLFAIFIGVVTSVVIYLFSFYKDKKEEKLILL